MDVARPQSVARNKKIKRAVYVFLFLIAASAVTLGLSRMSPAAPGVDGGTVTIGGMVVGTVEPGPGTVLAVVEVVDVEVDASGGHGRHVSRGASFLSTSYT